MFSEILNLTIERNLLENETYFTRNCSDPRKRSKLFEYFKPDGVEQ